jgi:hypothetical protein
MRSQKNRLSGAHFEAVLVHRAGCCGLWAIKQPHAYRWLPGGKIRPMRCELDFAIVRRDGKVSYADCKNFEGTSFARSALNKAQVARAAAWNAYKVPAGFIVHLRAADAVVFYSGMQIAKSLRGSSFKVGDGLLLGSAQTFGFDPIFALFEQHAETP